MTWCAVGPQVLFTDDFHGRSPRFSWRAYAAGQLDAAGQGGYPAAASVVAYIDATFGRDALKRLLRATSTVDALTMLGTMEPALLEAWGTSQR